MDHVHRLQRINAYPGQIDGPSRSEQHSWSTVTISPKTRADRSRSSSLQSYYTAPYAFTPPYVPSPPSVPTPPNAPSPPHGRTSHASYQSYYSANTSPMSYISTNTSSTLSSTLSSYSVASINSYKSRKTVLYPRRAHPPPVIVALEHSVSPEALIWQIRFLCTTLLPYAETRLMPAGNVLLQSLGPHGDFSQRLPVIDEGTLCCSELFVALTHEVLLKDAISAGQLEGPCKLLHTTFKNILFKLRAFSLPATRKLHEEGQKAPSAGALALERLSNVLRALCSIMDAFEGALVSVKPAAAKDGALGDHYRMALLELSVSTGLTMELYRKKLEQNLARNEAQLHSLRQSEGLLSPPTSTTPMLLPFKGAPKAISTIEEGSEAEGEGSSTSGHTQTHSSQSHAWSARSNSDSGKRSLSRRILHRLIPSTMGRKDG